MKKFELFNNLKSLAPPCRPVAVGGWGELVGFWRLWMNNQQTVCILIKACKPWVWGHALPGNGQKLDAPRFDHSKARSRALYSSYMARRVLHPLFGCPYMHLLTSNFHDEKK